MTRGFASLSHLYSAPETIAAIEKPTYLYYFGDYDPSGVEIDRNIERLAVVAAVAGREHARGLDAGERAVREHAGPLRKTNGATVTP